MIENATDVGTEVSRTERALRAMVAGTARATGEEFFREVVRHFAAALGVRYSFVGELADSGAERVRVLAVWVGSGFGEPFEYDLAGTPCENVVGQGSCCYQSGVRERFPRDRLLAEMSVESYFGTPLFDSVGCPLGILVALDDKPMRDSYTADTILSVFASRAAVELERARADRSLRESEEHYRTLFEQAPDGTLIVDPETTQAVQFNDAVCRQLGYSREEFARLRVSDYEAAELPEDTKRRVRQLLDAGAGDFETLHRTKSGEIRNVHVTAKTISLAGRPFFHCVFRDITERRQAEDAVRQSETSYRSLVEGSPYGIYRATEDGRLLAVNQALVAMLGYGSKDALLEAHLANDIFESPADRQRLVEGFHELDRIPPFETRWRRKDGSLITVRISGRTVRDAVGALECLEMIAEDVTERRGLEEQLRQAQKMEAIGQLAGGIAHDFNNLLTTVLASSELIARELPHDLPLRTDLEAIQHAAGRGAELTRKLLALGRRQPLEPRPLNLAVLVTDFSKMARRIVREDINIAVHAAAADIVVRADPGAVEQILMNLVTNARDAMPHGGSLRFLVDRITLDAEHVAVHGWGTPGDFAFVAVTDTGIGMDEETQRRIFEPFFTTKPVGSGTGLGMAMVYGLVQQLCGHVHVYSELGVGTTIKVYWPIATGAVTPSRAGPAPEPRGGTETVLLVEDEDALRRAAWRVLEKHGYSVLAAGNGAEALDLYEAHAGEIALVLSDVIMPQVSGPQLVAELRRRGHHPRILFMSGYTARDVRETQAIESGTPFLPKPWTIAELLGRVRKALDS